MRPTLEHLEPRECPSVVTYHGGAVLQNPRVANLFVGPYRPDLDRTADVMTTQYPAYLGVYGVGGGSHDGTAVLPDRGPLSDAQVRQLLIAQIAAGALPDPDGTSQAYMVYLDRPVTDGYGEYHWFFNLGGVRVPYGVAYSTDPAGGQAPSHEMAEMFTDPFLSGWYAGSAYSGEIADLGHGAEFQLAGLQVVTPVGPDGNYITAPTAFTPVVTYAQQYVNLARQIYGQLLTAPDPVTYYTLLYEFYWVFFQYQLVAGL